MLDLRFALRSLRRNPGFTAAAVLCLALGIGATSTVFGIVDALFFRPPPGVGDPGAIVRPYISERSSTVYMNNSWGMSYHDYVALRDATRSLSGMAAYASIGLSAGLGIDAQHVDGFLVTGNYFSVLQVTPALGRFFTRDEDAGPGSPPVVVISHEYWQRVFGGDRTAVGKAITLDGHRYTIIGVAPADFHGIDADPGDVWIPVSLLQNVGYQAESLTSTDVIWLNVVGRRAPGVTMAHARAELETLYRHAVQAHDRTRTPSLALGPILLARGPRTSPGAVIALWLALAAGLVLAIACANTANLLLARATVRRKEIAVRLSLGASRARLARQLVTESVLLSLLGAGGGLALALWGTDLVPVVGLPPLRFFAHGRVLVFTTVAAVACGLAFGLAPALAATRTDLASVLKEGAREGVDRRSRTRATLMIVQVALAVVLLTGAGLFVHSLRNIESVDVGFDPAHLLVANVDLATAGYSDSAGAQFDDRALERLRALPGVRSASLAENVPLNGGFMVASFRVPDAAKLLPTFGGSTDLQSLMQGPDATLTWYVGPGYFATIGTAVQQGRDFTDHDGAANVHVAIVNEAFATRSWPGKNALGHCIDMQSDGDQWTCYTVVGVAANAKYSKIEEPRRAAFFIPVEPANGSVRILLRTKGDPAAAISSVRRALSTLAPNLPYVSLKPLAELLRPQIQSRLLGASMFSVFGLLALVLAAIGLYGLMSYGVSQRARELGLRMALGAQRRDVLGLVLRQAIALTLVGLAVGTVAALAAARFVSHLLYQVSAADPWSLIGVAVLLITTAAVAAWLPARRASRVDPMVALRSE